MIESLLLLLRRYGVSITPVRVEQARAIRVESQAVLLAHYRRTLTRR